MLHPVDRVRSMRPFRRDERGLLVEVGRGGKRISLHRGASFKRLILFLGLCLLGALSCPEQAFCRLDHRISGGIFSRLRIAKCPFRSEFGILNDTNNKVFKGVLISLYMVAENPFEAFMWESGPNVSVPIFLYR